MVEIHTIAWRLGGHVVCEWLGVHLSGALGDSVSVLLVLVVGGLAGGSVEPLMSVHY